MMLPIRTRRCLLLLFSLSFITGLQAQTAQPAESKEEVHQMNYFKVNVTALVLKNYSLTYERVLSKPVSFVVSYRFMPTPGLPFANNVADAIGSNDPDAQKAVKSVQMSNYAITPELRFYLGKGYGKGFYISAFYRYASFKADRVSVAYNSLNSLDLSGMLTANTGGLLFGAQWPLGKHFSIDWWIVGAHYGSGKGNFSGVASRPLNVLEQDQLRQNLENIDIPLTTKTVAVNANGATVKLDGPWGGLRSGVLLGIKF